MNKKENNVGARLRPCPNNKGITLIALIITIIVMLVLVSVTISMAVNGGLFEKAGEATGKTENELNKEQVLSEGKIQINGAWYDSIDKYLAGEKSYESWPKITSENLATSVNKIVTENTKYEDDNGDMAIIPKGFMLTDEEEFIEDGIVIEDEAGNQFVWVPVEEGTFERATTNTTYIENASNDPTGEYNKMVASVEKYGGFYIGRYEAGSEENRREENTNTPDTTTLGVRKGLYPYNMVCWGTSMTEWEEEREYTSGSTTYDYGYGAVYLSRNMYTNKEAYGVTSTLCYGVQWDAALRFIRDTVDVTNSTNWGNYYGHEFEFTGEYSTDNGITWDDDETEKPEDETWLLTTGASEENQAKNIYDLAGNVREWTMEAYSSYNRVNRGGDYDCSGGNNPASDRNNYYPYRCDCYVGFRPSLYIK